jgi:hypothetical protein
MQEEEVDPYRPLVKTCIVQDEPQNLLDNEFIRPGTFNVLRAIHYHFITLEMRPARLRAVQGGFLITDEAELLMKTRESRDAFLQASVPNLSQEDMNQLLRIFRDLASAGKYGEKLMRVSEFLDGNCHFQSDADEEALNNSNHHDTEPPEEVEPESKCESDFVDLEPQDFVQELIISCLHGREATVEASASHPAPGRQIKRIFSSRKRAQVGLARHLRCIFHPMKYSPSKVTVHSTRTTGFEPVAIPETKRAVDAGQITRPSFENHLRSSIFDGQIDLISSCPEPTWSIGISEATALFSCWKAVRQYKLTPQGQFVAETRRTFDDLLNNAEFRIDMQVAGTGGGLGLKGLLGLLKATITDYQWQSFWLSSRDRTICIPEDFIPDSDDLPSLTGINIGTLELFDNELIGIHKYQGGKSPYLTVITHGDVFSGAISLFRASLGEDGLATKLDRVSYFRDIPSPICRILARQVKPNRYELNHRGNRLACAMTGCLPRPRPAFVSGVLQWTNIGGGRRNALHITSGSNTIMSREGLVATIPHILAFLHLRYRFLNDVRSSTIFTFQPSLSVKTKDGENSHWPGSDTAIRRGLKLTSLPNGPANLGDDLFISVLFPKAALGLGNKFSGHNVESNWLEPLLVCWEYYYGSVSLEFISLETRSLRPEFLKLQQRCEEACHV